MKLILTSLVVLGVCAGCSNNENRTAYYGQYFRAKVEKIDKQRDVFVVSVKDASKSLEGARAAAHHKATGYCVKTYGSSEIVWVNAPDDPNIPLRITDDTVRFQGRCPQAQ